LGGGAPNDAKIEDASGGAGSGLSAGFTGGAPNEAKISEAAAGGAEAVGLGGGDPKESKIDEAAGASLVIAVASESGVRPSNKSGFGLVGITRSDKPDDGSTSAALTP
jgi:hypothetical protein